jgi:hypothetical protein
MLAIALAQRQVSISEIIPPGSVARGRAIMLRKRIQGSEGGEFQMPWEWRKAH